MAVGGNEGISHPQKIQIIFLLCEVQTEWVYPTQGPPPYLVVEIFNDLSEISNT